MEICLRFVVNFFWYFLFLFFFFNMVGLLFISRFDCFIIWFLFWFLFLFYWFLFLFVFVILFLILILIFFVLVVLILILILNFFVLVVLFLILILILSFGIFDCFINLVGFFIFVLEGFLFSFLCLVFWFLML